MPCGCVPHLAQSTDFPWVKIPENQPEALPCMLLHHLLQHVWPSLSAGGSTENCITTCPGPRPTQYMKCPCWNLHWLIQRSWPCRLETLQIRTASWPATKKLKAQTQEITSALSQRQTPEASLQVSSCVRRAEPSHADTLHASIVCLCTASHLHKNAQTQQISICHQCST